MALANWHIVTLAAPGPPGPEASGAEGCDGPMDLDPGTGFRARARIARIAGVAYA